MGEKVMPRYIVTVFERAVIECEYEIEADDCSKPCWRVQVLRALRRPNGARDEFTLAATAQNLRKMAKLIRMQSLKAA